MAVYPLVPGTVHVAVQLTNRATVPVDAFQVTAQLDASGPDRSARCAVPLTHQSTGSWVARQRGRAPARTLATVVGVLTDPITEVDTAFHFTIYG